MLWSQLMAYMYWFFFFFWRGIYVLNLNIVISAPPLIGSHELIPLYGNVKCDQLPVSIDFWWTFIHIYWIDSTGNWYINKTMYCYIYIYPKKDWISYGIYIYIDWIRQCTIMAYIDRVQTEYLILSKPHKMRERERCLRR